MRNSNRNDFDLFSNLQNSSERFGYLNKYSGTAVAISQVAQPTEAGYSRFMSKTYLWMFFGLSLTFAVALFMTFKSVSVTSFVEDNFELYILVSVLSILLVLVMGIFIDKITPLIGKVIFIVYSLASGIIITPSLLTYTDGTIVIAFGITALLYLAMATIGLMCKKDMSKFGKVSPFVIVGVILYIAVSIFFKSTLLDTVMGALCIVIFMAFTVYDSSMLKKFYFSLKGDEKMLEKASVVCALQLYLDYILLFLVVLRFIGRRRK